MRNNVENTSNEHDAHSDTYACAWIRRLYSGLPYEYRRNRFLAVLQAFLDDSGRGKETDSKVFVIAGYAGPMESFSSFADEWQALLRENPALEYLKGKEANSLTGQFSGWTETERTARVLRFIDLIRKFGLIALSFAVPYREFNEILREPKGIMRYPYPVAFATMVAWLMTSAVQKSELEQIELIFDQGMIGRERAIQAAYEGIKGSLSKEMLGLLAGRPRFEDDKRYLPLQAADLLAWNVRRDCAEQLTTLKQWESVIWTQLRTGIKGKGLFMDSGEMRAFKARKDASYLERIRKTELTEK